MSPYQERWPVVASSGSTRYSILVPSAAPPSLTSCAHITIRSLPPAVSRYAPLAATAMAGGAVAAGAAGSHTAVGTGSGTAHATIRRHSTAALTPATARDARSRDRVARRPAVATTPPIPSSA